MTTNSAAIDRFCDELRADLRFAQYADQIRTDLMGLDSKSDTCPDHAAYFDALRYVFTRGSRPLTERLEKLARLSSQKGYVVVNLKEFAGW
jgi:hypothetical protein